MGSDLSQGGRRPPDAPSGPSTWSMTWSDATSGRAPTGPGDTPGEPGSAPAGAEPPGLAEDLADLHTPYRPYRARRLPRPLPGPALTTLFVAALSILLVAVALVWPAPIR